MSGNARGKSNPNAVSEADQDEGPTLSQIMAQLKVILAEQSVMKTFLSVCSGKMDEMQKQLKKQEDLVKDCTRKIQTFEAQNESLLRENVELKGRLLGLKDHPQENIECAQGTPGSAGDDVIAVVETLGNPHMQDYYWKEYTQEIPEEALPGGTDCHGNVTYIGQTIDRDRVVPGNLDPTRQMLFYAMAERSNATERNIKVLCVHTPEAYEWVRTNIMAIRFRNSLNQRHLVVGGHYCQHPYFIDYYWKEYTQEIPDEALPGGTDSHGNITYIGQTIDMGKVVPGNLNATSQILFYAMSERQNTTVSNIKVLCVRTPEAYEWVRTNFMDIRFLNQRHLVAGGYYNEYPYLIGRTACAGQIVVGKIYLEKFACATEDTVYYKKSEFEVLVYNPRTPAKVTISKKGNSLGSNSTYCINVH